jgi:hypothetical protein
LIGDFVDVYATSAMRGRYATVRPSAQNFAAHSQGNTGFETLILPSLVSMHAYHVWMGQT